MPKKTKGPYVVDEPGEYVIQVCTQVWYYSGNDRIEILVPPALADIPELAKVVELGIKRFVKMRKKANAG